MPDLRVPVAASAALTLAACMTLPAAPPHANVPSAPLRVAIDVCWLEYETDRLPGDFGTAGPSDRTAWEVTMSGVLIRHPTGGDIVIDAGKSSHFAQERVTSGFVASILLTAFQDSGRPVASAPAALRALGIEPASLKGVAISHIHADHAGGVMDLPNVPVLLSAEELAFANAEQENGTFDVIRAQAVAIAARAKPIRFEAKPYANFDRSLDYFGDGSVVFVPLFGHTPGTIGTFVNRSPTERYLHVGDAVNTLEALEKRRGKSFAMSITDHDGAAAEQVVAKLEQLHELDPGLRFLPAHDCKAWREAFGAPGTCRAPH